MGLMKFINKKKNLYMPRDINYFILIDKKGLRDLKTRILEYCEIYCGTKKEYDICICKPLANRRSSEKVIVLPMEIGIFNIVNIFSWLSDKHNENNILICSNGKVPRETFIAQMDIENESRDTIVGGTSQGYKFYAYLPECYSLEAFDIFDSGDDSSSVELILQRRGYASLDEFKDGLEIIYEDKFTIAI